MMQALPDHCCDFRDISKDCSHKYRWMVVINQYVGGEFKISIRAACHEGNMNKKLSSF